MVKKEPTKPIAKKEPQKLMKKNEPEVQTQAAPIVPAVHVASQPVVPALAIDNTSKGAYIVMEEGEQKIIDFGEEKVRNRHTDYDINII